TVQEPAEEPVPTPAPRSPVGKEPATTPTPAADPPTNLVYGLPPPRHAVPAQTEPSTLLSSSSSSSHTTTSPHLHSTAAAMPTSTASNLTPSAAASITPRGSRLSAFEDSGSGLPSGEEEEDVEEGGSGFAVTTTTTTTTTTEEPAVPTATPTGVPAGEERSSCDNTPFGCCPDGRTASSTPEGANCPPTMSYSGFLHLDQVEGQEVFYTPEMEDPKSELFGETARSIESAVSTFVFVFVPT
ncbi:hypothetical protein CRUP_032385, partial [Coryphaenoides rupestris]